ncbi:type III-A CRISPR-associated protein Cas10/Csm1 [Eubacterium limosum]|uniref:type III-A CRISPR-associated protein Cas10/Csm1 n=1 Tax=Eubacterium limosum TaxID=1736 RepID=UPI00371E5029
MDKENKKRLQLALLHTIGLLVSRAEGTHTPVESGIAFLNEQLGESQRALAEAPIVLNKEKIEASVSPDRSLYQLISEAGKIAMASDTLLQEDLSAQKPAAPLESVFDTLANEREPIPGEKAEAPDYAALIEAFKSGLETLQEQEFPPNGLLQVLERAAAKVPLLTNTPGQQDISVYDYTKMTTAIAAALYAYHEAHQTLECVDLASDHERQVNKFLFVSGTVFGIQKFIYTISSTRAMKSLRGRSFFLEILVENLIDDLLEKLSLCRANALYTGGGHFYLLLPNTREANEWIEKAQTIINDQLLERYGLSMYLAIAAVPCSSAELANGFTEKAGKNQTGALYDRVNKKLSEAKFHRYTEENLRDLFDPDSSLNANQKDGRECNVCHRSTKDLKTWEEGEGEICKSCTNFIELGDHIVRFNGARAPLIVIYPDTEKDNEAIFLPTLEPEQKYILDIEPMGTFRNPKNPKNYHRVYAANAFQLDIEDCYRLLLANYNIPSQDETGHLVEFEELANRSEGAKRLAVMRADVDNLGATFVKGFIREQSNQTSLCEVSIVRYATLSRQLSEFFKEKVNRLCQNSATETAAHLPGKALNPEKRRLVIVYSGGDDMFVIGTWEDTIEFSLDLQKAFEAYTHGKLSFSAGIGLFHCTYPVSRMAEDTEVLESDAKEWNHWRRAEERERIPHKNNVALFGGRTPEDRQNHIYTWPDFEQYVLSEKFKALTEWFVQGHDQNGQPLEASNSFIYRLKNLFETASPQNINIARLAYEIGRRKPSAAAPKTLRDTYYDFRERIYQWIQNDWDRKEFITAVTIFIYLHREKPEGGGNKEHE